MMDRPMDRADEVARARRVWVRSRHEHEGDTYGEGTIGANDENAVEDNPSTRVRTAGASGATFAIESMGRTMGVRVEVMVDGVDVGWGEGVVVDQAKQAIGAQAEEMRPQEVESAVVVGDMSVQTVREADNVEVEEGRC